MGEQGKIGKDLKEEATGWLVALDCGTADALAFEAWRGTSPYHASAFAQAAALWRSTADRRIAGAIDTSFDEPVPTQAPGSVESFAQGPMTRRRAMAGSTLAAMLGLGALGGWMAWPRRAYATTGVGEQRSIRLPDGSHAMLNTDTRLAWRFGQQREVWIEQGEAALLVRAGPQALALHGGGLEAQLGSGSFNLRLSGDEANLLVLAGQARLDHGRTLWAGQMAKAQGRSIAIAGAPRDVLGAATAWQQGKIVFNGMPLGQAIAEFNRYLPVRIMLEDQGLAATTLGGEFRVDDPDRFLAALSAGFDIGHRQQGDQILLYRLRAGAPQS